MTMETQKIKFTFDYFSSSYKASKFEASRDLKPSDSIRKAAISVMQEALEEGANIWASEIDEDSAIQIYVSSKTLTNTHKGWEESGFGLKYSLNKDGSLRILSDYEPLGFDWTLAEIETLISSGYINGNSQHIIVGLPSGLGATPRDLFDWLGFFANVIQIGGLPAVLLARTHFRKLAWYPYKHKKIRSIAKNWKKNGIKYPSQLREFIDTKASWRLDEVKQRLNLDDEYAIELLCALGLEAQKNEWRLSHSTQSIKNRRNWMRNEKKYLKKIGIEND